MRLAIVRAGADDGPVAALVHGITGSADSRPVVTGHLAARGFCIVVPDLRGHGTSPHPATGFTLDDHVDDLVETLGGEVDVLVGHSLGGALAVRAVASGKLRVRAVVLEDPVLTLTRAHAEEVVATELALDPSDLAGAARRAPGWSTADLLGKALALVRLSPDAVRASFVGNSPWDVTDDLVLAAALSDVTVILPEVSPYNDEERVAWLRETLGDGAVHCVAGAGHSVHRDRPDVFLELLDTATGACR